MKTKKLGIRIINKLKLLKYLNIQSKIVLNGRRFKIPILAGVGFFNLFISELWMIDLLKIVLPIEDKKFVDVGVNIGQTLLKVRSISSSIDYIGFEPNPMCIHYVTRLIEENEIKKTKLIPVGIADQTHIGELHFFHDTDVDNSATILLEFRDKTKIRRKEYVPLFDITEVKRLINLDEISVLKIDVEGAELEVLRSFSTELEKNRPFIFIEILPSYNKDYKYRVERQKEIETLLNQLEYSIFRVIKQNEVLVNLKELPGIEVHSDLNNCEYVMVPNAKKEAFISSYQNWFNNK